MSATGSSIEQMTARGMTPWPKGVSGNPSGKSKRQLEWETRLHEAHTVERVLEVIEAMREKAMAGDPLCAKLYLERVIGPVPRQLDDEQVVKFAELMVAALRREAAVKIAAEQATVDATVVGEVRP